ncbi:MAG: LuxR C-terminal-related transcriptional regulator [Bacteroidota bacterium]
MQELNSKEKKVLKLICQGLSSTQIGELINKSPRTVEGYRSNLYEKLGVKNKIELIAFAFKHGLESD